MTPLAHKLVRKQSGILLYGLTPPKLDQDPETLRAITQTRIERLRELDMDGLVIYDLQDESSRTTEQRPFRFLRTVDAARYAEHDLAELDRQKIVYRCVGKYGQEELRTWMSGGRERITVFVGKPNRNEISRTSLQQSYELAADCENVILGGVAIAERHAAKGDEHLRLVQKSAEGVEYFITQCIFDVVKMKDLLSDYYYYCRDNNVDMKPLIFTITPCGSMKSLEFLQWLGIDTPRWIRNDIHRSIDTLARSMKVCLDIVDELVDYSMAKRIPVGCNIESVSIRKGEILASLDLFNQVRELFQRKGLG